MTQNVCDKTNTLPKVINCAEYTKICMHCLVWGIVLEISHEIANKWNSEKFWSETYSNDEKNGIWQWATIHRKQQEQKKLKL